MSWEKYSETPLIRKLRDRKVEKVLSSVKGCPYLGKVMSLVKGCPCLGKVLSLLKRCPSLGKVLSLVLSLLRGVLLWEKSCLSKGVSLFGKSLVFSQGMSFFGKSPVLSKRVSLFRRFILTEILALMTKSTVLMGVLPIRGL